MSFFILLLCLAADIILHKGMSRVMLPESFTDKRSPQNFSTCNQLLTVSNKKWIKAVNTISLIEKIPGDVPGFECDVYFDTSKNYLQVYHDSAGYMELNFEAILKVYQTRKLSASIWLDFKNLSAANEKKSLNYLIALRNQYKLQNKLIIESSSPKSLQSFCDSNFFTSFYTPFFNPYSIKEAELIKHLDSITSALKQYKVSALSGYYFQYPVLKKYFPNYPILTWSDNSNISLVSNAFNKILLDDSHVKLVLFP